MEYSIEQDFRSSINELNDRVTRIEQRFTNLESGFHQLNATIISIAAKLGFTLDALVEAENDDFKSNSPNKDVEIEACNCSTAKNPVDGDATIGTSNINETVVMSSGSDDIPIETNAINDNNLIDTVREIKAGQSVQLLKGIEAKYIPYSSNSMSSYYISGQIQSDHLVHNPWFGLVLGTVVHVISILRLRPELLILSRKELFEDLITCDLNAYHWY